MIKDVYMVDRIDDYVVSFVYPNVHFILDSGEELQAPIYSPRMYDFCRGSDAMSFT